LHSIYKADVTLPNLLKRLLDALIKTELEHLERRGQGEAGPN
jgi:hypothetical protein